jgi:hypothetical protein
LRLAGALVLEGIGSMPKALDFAVLTEAPQMNLVFLDDPTTGRTHRSFHVQQHHHEVLRLEEGCRLESLDLEVGKAG